MAPIPVYTSSPIHASKASGVTPQTAPARDAADAGPGHSATTTSVPQSTQHAYPPAAPGAVPSLPKPTGIASQFSDPQPTPTRPNEAAGPPPPQPGAVPIPTAARHIPPPPKAGETQRQTQTQTTAMPMPPQMSYPPPTASYSAYGGSSTSIAVDTDFSHPPGYQQNVHASELNSNQRVAYNASAMENSQGLNGEGVWDTARKWATAAGESLAAAEGEVWKRINKE
ncbi:hypothetical protein B0I35DRAFT_420031 [Stachybotrys elegans]|uniref:Uncharacterized protein n=1 Tax=Stachybotrys elegans TaxID=80388 RepID=A0A8K0T2P8_9HYPO|nr:hypothetical protein B0I35DRAFT_420031 [Stachybotrys elegans]